MKMNLSCGCCGPKPCSTKWLPADWDEDDNGANEKYFHGVRGNLTYHVPFGTIQKTLKSPSLTRVEVADESLPWGDGVRRHVETVEALYELDYAYSNGPYQWVNPDTPASQYTGPNPGDLNVRIPHTFLGSQSNVPDCRTGFGIDVRQNLTTMEGGPIPVNLSGEAPPETMAVRFDNISCYGLTRFDTSELVTFNRNGHDYTIRLYTNSAMGFGPHDLTGASADGVWPTPKSRPGNGSLSTPHYNNIGLLILGVPAASVVYDLHDSEPTFGGTVTTPVGMTWENGEVLARLTGMSQLVEMQIEGYRYHVDANQCRFVSGHGGTVSGPAGDSSNHVLSPRAVFGAAVSPDDYPVARAPQMGTPAIPTFGGWRPSSTYLCTMSELCEELGVAFDPLAAYIGVIDFSWGAGVGPPVHITPVAEDSTLINATGNSYDYSAQRFRRTYYNPFQTLIAELDMVFVGQSNGLHKFTGPTYLLGDSPASGEPIDEWTGAADAATFQDPDDFEFDLERQMNADYSDDISGTLAYFREDLEPEP